MSDCRYGRRTCWRTKSKRSSRDSARCRRYRPRVPRDSGPRSENHWAPDRVTWIALRVTPDSNRDGVIAALFAAGSQGVQEDGAAVVTHFPADAPIADIE